MHFSFATTDLQQNIEKGNYPKWKVYVQMIDPADEDFINGLSFDILDTTKEWPLDLIKPIEVGIMEFNKNVDSQQLENEQIAFSPSRLVPGIEPSDEKMLQTRLFAYADTQRQRLGVNNQMLPVNAPKCRWDGLYSTYKFQNKCKYFPNFVDGTMNFSEPSITEEVNY